MPIDIIGGKVFRAEERLSTNWEVRIEEMRARWSQLDSRSNRDQWQPWNGQTSHSRSLWDTMAAVGMLLSNRPLVMVRP